MNLVAVATSDYLGFILLIALLISSRIRRSNVHLEFRMFTVITILTMVACFVDFLGFWVDGKSGLLFRIINVAANTYCFMANPVFVASWCLYEDVKLYHSMKRVKKIYTYAFIPAIIMVALTIINLFIPMIFYIDANNTYHRLVLSYIFYAIDAIYLSFSVFIYLSYQAKYGKIRFFPLYLMLGPICLGCALQLVFYGVSLIWVSMAIGLTSIYMSIQNEFSYLDKLTGLYNRAYLDYLLEIGAKENQKRLGGIMIDVDYFKQINDTYGHSAGDEALTDVARIITFAKTDKAIATRFAGDEFIILLKNTTENELQGIIDNIKEEVKNFNEVEQRAYKLSLSLGYSMYDPSTNTIDDFLRHMDDNMYKEKEINHAK